MPDELARMEPVRLRDWLVAQRVTVGFAPTPLAEALIAMDWPAETALKTLLTGGDVLHQFAPPSLPFVLVNNYGPTETAVVATSGEVPVASGTSALPSIGRPIDGVDVHVVDENLHPIPAGNIGELLIGGVGLARGYLHRPDLTDEKFIRDPFSCEAGARLYRTGDLVRWNVAGELEFAGRRDDQVKIRGQRIELGEVSAALDHHPSVRSSVVVVVKSQSGEPRLVAYMVPAGKACAGELALRNHLAQSLPEYMVPGDFIWISEMPVTPNGKVDREALPAPHSDDISRPPSRSGADSHVQKELARLVGELLGIQAVGTQQNFFMLGGHSLLGAQLIARIDDLYGVQLPLRSIFDRPTVADMAAEVEALLVADVVAMSEDEAERVLGAAQVMPEALDFSSGEWRKGE
jgi:acyl carrier protein